MRLLLFAHRPEAAVFFRQIKWVKDTVLPQLFLSHENDLALLLTGMGEEQLIANFEMAIQRLPKIESLINFGICGGLNQMLPLNKAVTVGRVVLLIDDKHTKRTLELDPNSTISCLTSDMVIDNLKTANELSKYADIVDMELFYLASLATKYQLPIASIKCISDHADRHEDISSIKQKASQWGQELFNKFKQL